MNLFTDAKITKVTGYTAANTTAVNSASVDMSGYTSVTFVAVLGTAAANNTMNAAQGADDSSDWQDLEGTSVSSNTSDEVIVLEINRPTDRYVRAEIARGTSTTVESIIAIQRGARKMPVDNTTTGTITGEVHASPAEGTA